MTNIFPTDYVEKVTPVANDKVLLADSADWDEIKYGKYTNFIGQPWIVRKWVYNALTPYVATDVVSYNNSAYYCILATTGNLPTNTTYWTPFAVGAGIGWPVTSVNENIVVWDWTDGENIKDWWYTIAQLIDSFTISSFGDWSDWDVTIVGTVTLTKDMYYNNLVIPTATILNPAGYRIFVKWTLTGAGKIQRNGNNATNASWITHWNWWAVLNQGTLNADTGWSNGWDGSFHGWAIWAWVDWISNNPSYSTINWVAGWTWWWATNWWAAWTSTRGTLYNVGNLLNWFNLIWPASFAQWLPAAQYKGISWSGWWGWGSDSGWSSGWWGGGAWGNGGFIWLAVNTINRTWVFEAIWWAWWNWGNGWGWVCWGWGGWSWGNGWVIVVIYKTKTAIGTSTLTWWALWTKWTGTAWWANWADWTAGNAWVLIEIDI